MNATRTLRPLRRARHGTGPALVALALCLQGCATPQAALDQANATAGLASRFDGEWTRYRQTAAQVAEARLANIRRQEVQMARLADVQAWNLRTARLAGLGDAEDRRQSLISLAESLQADEQAHRQRLVELDAQLAALLAPLPVTTGKLAALKKALAEMGTELPASDRLKLALDAATTVRDEVAKNRAAAQAAIATAASAPLPAAPAGSAPATATTQPETTP